jgi:hypothetical protein
MANGAMFATSYLTGVFDDWMPNEEIVAGQQAAAELAFSRIIKDMTIYY